MTHPNYYSVQTVFGEFRPTTVKDLVRDYNARVDESGLGKAYRLNVGSLHRYIREGNTLGHFRNLVISKCHGRAGPSL